MPSLCILCLFSKKKYEFHAAFIFHCLIVKPYSGLCIKDRVKLFSDLFQLNP